MQVLAKDKGSSDEWATARTRATSSVNSKILFREPPISIYLNCNFLPQTAGCYCSPMKFNYNNENAALFKGENSIAKAFG